MKPKKKNNFQGRQFRPQNQQQQQQGFPQQQFPQQNFQRSSAQQITNTQNWPAFNQQPATSAPPLPPPTQSSFNYPFYNVAPPDSLANVHTQPPVIGGVQNQYQMGIQTPAVNQHQSGGNPFQGNQVQRNQFQGNQNKGNQNQGHLQQRNFNDNNHGNPNKNWGNQSNQNQRTFNNQGNYQGNNQGPSGNRNNAQGFNPGAPNAQNNPSNKNPRQPNRFANQQTTSAPGVPVAQTEAPKDDPSAVMSALSEEEIAFDEQFRKWEDEFNKWKSANLNHPDKVAYGQYESQFEAVRQKLLSRRNEMLKKKLEQQKLMNPPKTAEQLKFETHWQAGPPPTTSQKSSAVPKPIIQQNFSQETFEDDHFDEVSFNRFDTNQRKKDFSFIGGQQISTSSEFDLENDEASFSLGSFNFNADMFQSIPGLDLPSIQPPPPIREASREEPKNVINLDPEIVSTMTTKIISVKGPPPMPLFSDTSRQIKRATRPIDEILEEPGRSKREPRILIFIRGAPGSGKSYLANLIIEREIRHGNMNCTTLNIDKYVADGPIDRIAVQKYNEIIVEDFRQMVQKDIYNFVVIEIEGPGIRYFNQCYHNATTFGHFKCYAIEIHQTLETCLQFNRHNRTYEDIKITVDSMKEIQTPLKAQLLDPTSLLQRSAERNLNSEASTTAQAANPPTNNLSNITSNITQLLQDKNVLNLVQSQLMPPTQPPPSSPQKQTQNTMNQPTNSMNQSLMNMQQQSFMNQSRPPMMPQQFQKEMPRNNNRQQNQPGMLPGKENFNYNHNDSDMPQEPTYENCPTFTPAKIIDYKHVHMPTLSEQLLEFKVFRVIDYKHTSTYKLRQYIADVNIEQVIEKRKAVALRKKILEYLKNAERPEDTVSNPKYPKNWEEIEKVNRDYKAPGIKRGKKLTVKIIRVKKRFEYELRGSKRFASQSSNWMTKGYEQQEQMDLSDISSEEDDDKANVVDESKTKMDLIFNPYNHEKTFAINDVLWNPSKVRRERILILLRGAPGSGKSHLTGLIKQKEQAAGNSLPRIISINNYFEEDWTDITKQMVNMYSVQMVKYLEKTIKDGHHKFIMIDAEITDLSFYNKFYEIGKARGYDIYTIELHKPLSYCLSHNKNHRAIQDIEAAVDQLKTHRIASDHSLLIPTSLYKEFNCVKEFLGEDSVATTENEDNDVLFVEPEEEKPMELDEDSLDSVETISDENSRAERNFQLPEFNWHKREIEDIQGILEEPGRSRRADKIMIIFRGAPGAGKSYLVNLIREKESSMGNAKGFASLSLEDYFVNTSNHYQYKESQVEQAKKALLEDVKIIDPSKNFVVVDAENGNLKDYNELRNVGTENGFKCYAIELYLDAAKCKSQNIHSRRTKHIQAVVDLIEKNQIPSDHVLLDPSYLYDSMSEDQDMFEYDDTGQDVSSPLRPPSKLPEFNWHNRKIEDLRSVLEVSDRPEKIIIVLRGAPNSGKSYLADLIKRKESSVGKIESFRLLSLKDVQKDEKDFGMDMVVNKLEELLKKPEVKFVVVDADCCDLLYYNQIYETAKTYNFTGFTIELMLDEDLCIDNEEMSSKNKLLQDIPTPDGHTLLDPEYLFEEFKEDFEDEEDGAEASFGPLKMMATTKSKWEDDGDADPIDRLDGTRNKTFERFTMANYLQTEDEWTMRPSTSAKKRVRWADIEEKKYQERMRDIGFIVGQTDWNRMTDTTDGRSALEKMKYIEPRAKK